MNKTVGFIISAKNSKIRGANILNKKKVSNKIKQLEIRLC